MTLFKISAIILFYFVSRAVFAAPCETLTGLGSAYEVCWNSEIKGWISKTCLSEKCQAMIFLHSPSKKIRVQLRDGGYNPAAMVCHALRYPVIVLKDSRNNEQSYCLFPDKSLVSADAVERHVK